MGTEKPLWVNASQAARMLGKSRRTLANLVDRGLVDRRRESDAHPWEYSVSSIETYTSAPEAEPADMLLGQAYSAINTLIGPARQFSEMLQKQNEALLKRVAELEARHDELITAREELLDQRVYRDLATKEVASISDRKERAFRLIESTVAPKLLAAVGGGGSAAKLLSSFTDEQLTLFLNTDLISDEQKKLLQDVIKSKGGTIETEGSTDAA